jgi:hypothetical protein
MHKGLGAVKGHVHYRGVVALLWRLRTVFFRNLATKIVTLSLATGMKARDIDCLNRRLKSVSTIAGTLHRLSIFRRPVVLGHRDYAGRTQGLSAWGQGKIECRAGDFENHGRLRERK